MTKNVFFDGAGSISRHADFASRHVAPRHVDVWLPPSYHEHPERRYPVIYMHDGQNLFDPALVITGVDWGIDEAMLRVMRETGSAGAIVVGIWCTLLRRREYMPQAVFATSAGRALLPQFIAEAGGEPCSDQYLAFLADEVKPFIDATYRTQPDQPNTFVMGSSMGGLVSLYAVSQYPDLFGGAACVSTHWPIGGSLLVADMGARLPPAGRHRLYFDYGTAGLDAAYEPFQLQMDAHLRAAGYAEGHDWRTLKFEGADHNEMAWSLRAHLPLAWLLARPAGPE